MKTVYRIVSALLLISLLSLCFTACGPKKTPPPDLESVREELIERIENSKEINEIFWGEGLPVIPIGSELAEELGLYSEYNITTTDDLGLWEYVDTQKTKHFTFGKIKELAESAYSLSFLKSVYVSQLEGIYDSVSGSMLLPHYYEDDFGLWRNVNSAKEFGSIENMRVFDYSTIKMDVEKSSGERIYIILDAHYENDDSVFSSTLAFDKQGDGWYLAGPSY